MNSESYLKALDKLKLTRASKRTAAAFGLSIRQCQKIARGDAEVTPMMERLIAMYLKHGLPKGLQK